MGCLAFLAVSCAGARVATPSGAAAATPAAATPAAATPAATAPAAAAAPPAAATPAAAPAGAMPPIQRVGATPKGQLKNPYTDDNADIVEAGRKAYFRAGCNGCHGGNGGGGMCPPLTNDTWVYGGDDDTLFRLVSLGSDELQSKGYTRKGHENVVGPMPPMGAIVATDDDLWHILTFVRSNYHGAPECKLGCPPP
jgi:mono/diheme cytochrome c family protein